MKVAYLASEYPTDFAKSQTWRWSAPEHWNKVHIIRCGVEVSP